MTLSTDFLLHYGLRNFRTGGFTAIMLAEVGAAICAYMQQGRLLIPCSEPHVSSTAVPPFRQGTRGWFKPRAPNAKLFGQARWWQPLLNLCTTPSSWGRERWKSPKRRAKFSSWYRSLKTTKPVGAQQDFLLKAPKAGKQARGMLSQQRHLLTEEK